MLLSSIFFFIPLNLRNLFFYIKEEKWKKIKGQKFIINKYYYILILFSSDKIYSQVSIFFFISKLKIIFELKY